MNYKGKKDAIHHCLNCDKIIPFKGYTYHHKYCDNSCQGAYKNKSLQTSIFSKIEKGLKLNFCSSTTQMWYKKYIISKYGNQCMKCGWNKLNTFTNKIPVELDHIDGNCENNDINNLRLLCPCCHSLTEHFKGGNTTYRKRGVKSKRYLEWKESFKN